MFKDFDDFVMVDWSANGKRKTGKDSIWVASLHDSPKNHPTRYDCYEYLEKMFLDCIRNNKRILCGFDFCFGLPKGSVSIMRKAMRDNSENEDWEWLWQYLFDNIEDNEKNNNNRFEVGSKMNHLLTGKKGPFWGYPTNSKKSPPDYLASTKDKSITGGMFVEKRTTEGKSAFSVWQLLGAGSVGSQSLLGIAYLQKFRNHEKIGKHISVYPFEDCTESLIVIAESYYSDGLLTLDETIEIKDKAQVMAAVEYCKSLQDNNELAKLFSKIKNPEVSKDEGWIFTESNR